MFKKLHQSFLNSKISKIKFDTFIAISGLIILHITILCLYLFSIIEGFQPLIFILIGWILIALNITVDIKQLYSFYTPYDILLIILYFISFRLLFSVEVPVLMNYKYYNTTHLPLEYVVKTVEIDIVSLLTIMLLIVTLLGVVYTVIKHKIILSPIKQDYLRTPLRYNNIQNRK